MNSAKWHAGQRPSASADSPFQPFDITPEAAANLADILADGASGSRRIRQFALRTRKRVEGEAFTLFLTTVTAFCEQERDAALEEFDESRVPATLHALIPLARQIGVGDDDCRALFVSRMRMRDRREATAFFWLRAAADELTPARASRPSEAQGQPD